MTNEPSSLICIHGEYQGHDVCGYCHQEKSIAYGITAISLDSHIYDKLINIGWRRSGCFLYKPIMYRTCCPQYTIRLEVQKFKINKNQKLVLRRFERYLQTGSILQPTTDNISVPASAIINMETNNHIFASLKIETVLPEFTIERYELYRKYQVAVHNDVLEELTEAGFTRFLCDTPLVHSSTLNKVEEKEIEYIDPLASDIVHKYKYGSYHQLYRLNDTLIAVSVIDILPTGLSSVYLFYDPDYRHLVLGKYTALHDIEFCKQLKLKYYYMGYYIHTCEKMRYKGEYQPSELLCPTSLSWYPLSTCLPLLEKYKFTPFQPDLMRQYETVLLEQSTQTIASSSVADDSEFKAPTDAASSQSERFAPQFPARASLSDIPLDLKNGELLMLNDLNTRGKKILTPILEGFVNQTGDIATQIVVKLY